MWLRVPSLASKVNMVNLTLICGLLGGRVVLVKVMVFFEMAVIIVTVTGCEQNCTTLLLRMWDISR